MSTADHCPPVWFERPVLPDLVELVDGGVHGPRARNGRRIPMPGSSDAAGAVAGASPYDGAVMDRAPGLRVIARTGIGYDRVDVAAATARGIAVCNTPDGPTVSTAEHAVTLMLMVAKKREGRRGVAPDRDSGRLLRPPRRHRARWQGPRPRRLRPDRPARGGDRRRDRDARSRPSIPYLRPDRRSRRASTSDRDPRALLRDGGRRLGPRPVDRRLARHVRRRSVRAR